MTAPAAFRIPFTGTRWSGVGALDRLGETLAAVGARRCLVVVGSSLAAAPGVLDAVERAASGRVAAVFDGVRSHTPYTAVLAAAAVGRAAAVDGVVSLGGGAAVDTARLAALCLAERIEDATELRGLRARRTAAGLVTPTAAASALPHVAIPTTLSAAEYSDGGAATWSPTGEKDLFVGPGLTASAVLADTALAATTPVRTWLTTGVRALDHAVETLLSPRGSDVTDELSTAAVRLLLDALPAALADPADLDVRARAQLGAFLSYTGVSTGTLGLSHAVGHQLGGRLGVPHGAASSIALPAVLRLLAGRAGPRSRLVAAVLGIRGPETDEALLIACADALSELFQAWGSPRTLREVGVGSLDSEALADAVLADILVDGAPGGAPRRDEVIELLDGLA